SAASRWWRLSWLAAAVFGSLACAVPVLIGLASGADYTPFPTPSLTSPFFFCPRVPQGERASVWLPPGQILSVLQHGLLRPLRSLAGWDGWSLRDQMNLFGRTTSGVIVLLHALVLLFCSQFRSLNWADKALVFSVALFPLYVIQFAGVGYTSMSDYYHLSCP